MFICMRSTTFHFENSYWHESANGQDLPGSTLTCIPWHHILSCYRVRNQFVECSYRQLIDTLQYAFVHYSMHWYIKLYVCKLYEHRHALILVHIVVCGRIHKMCTKCKSHHALIISLAELLFALVFTTWFAFGITLQPDRKLSHGHSVLTFWNRLFQFFQLVHIFMLIDLQCRCPFGISSTSMLPDLGVACTLLI